MKLALNLVNSYVDLTDVPLSKIIQRLIEGGFEVEEIIEKKNGNNLILDISAPANRVENLSISGMIKELGCLLNKPIQLNTLINHDCNDWKNKLEKQIEKKRNSNFCTAFLIFKIENIKQKSTPDWLKKQLINSDIEPCNNLLDYQNYILLESGYPFEFYDLKKIQEETNNKACKLNLVTFEKNKKILTPSNEPSKISDSTLLLTANNTSIGIAGLIPHKNFICTDKTTSILIEASIFTPKLIRQQSKLTNCRTDRSIRYEKDIQNYDLVNASYRLIKLLEENSPDLTHEIYPGKNFIEIKSNYQILLHYSKLLQIIQEDKNTFYSIKYSLTPKQISNYLNRLGFNYKYDKLNLNWLVKIPSYRSKQINHQIHLIQELIRIHGFNQFPNLLPKSKKSGQVDQSYTLRELIITHFILNGMYEIVNYSTINYDLLTHEKFKIVNPLNSDYSKLRFTLLPNIVKTIIENKQNGNKKISAFECGHGFRLNSNSEIYNEHEYLSGIYNDEYEPLNKENKEQWDNFKGLFIKLFNQLEISIIWENNVHLTYKGIEKLLNPKRMVVLKLHNKTELGIIGQIHPNLRKNLPLNTFLFELNFDLIINQANQSKLFLYDEYTKYPAVSRYLVINISEKIVFKDLINFIKINGSNYLKAIKLIYRNKNEPFENLIQYKFSLTFQSKNLTLSNEKITLIMNTIENKVNRMFKV